jgi:hypothetical protein
MRKSRMRVAEHVKVKVNFTLELTTKSQRYNCTLSLTSALDGVVNATPWPLYPRLPIVQKAGWVPGLVWRGTENLASSVVRCPDRQSHSEALYRLSYPAGPTGWFNEKLMYAKEAKVYIDQFEEKLQCMVLPLPAADIQKCVSVYVRCRQVTCGTVGTPIMNCYFLSGNPQCEVTLWQSIIP